MVYQLDACQLELDKIFHIHVKICNKKTGDSTITTPTGMGNIYIMEGNKTETTWCMFKWYQSISQVYTVLLQQNTNDLLGTHKQNEIQQIKCMKRVKTLMSKNNY